MSSEDIFGKISPPGSIDKKVESFLLADVKANNGLFFGTYKGWEEASNANPSTVKGLKEILTYEEQIRKVLPEAEANFVLNISNPSKVEEYNKLVAQFNEELIWTRKSGNHIRANQLAMYARDIRLRKIKS